MFALLFLDLNLDQRDQLEPNNYLQGRSDRLARFTFDSDLNSLETAKLQGDGHLPLPIMHICLPISLSTF